jgi:uncharacterized protein DUF3106
MLRRILQPGFALLSPLLLAPVLLAITLAAGSSASAQPRAQRDPQLARQRAAPNANNPKPGERRMLAMPPAWVQQLRQMTPQQQERFFNNNERFRALPPQRQAQIRQQMQQWNRLSPDQRQTMLNRQQVWDRLTPQQQGYVRETLLPQWQKTPPAQRQAILGKLRQLRGLDDAQKTAKLNDESFLGGLDPQDRQMLRDLSNLRVGPGEAGGPPAEP